MSGNVTIKPIPSQKLITVKTIERDNIHYPVYANSYYSTVNTTTTALDNGENFTAEWEDTEGFDSIIVAVKTDQHGYYIVEFSPDGVNTDSSLTRYYKTTQIEPPHRFTITRQYVRVRYYNDSGSNQTYIRLTCKIGGAQSLNIPVDATMSQDYDAIATRPTDWGAEVALGRRQGSNLWNKFGYNLDLDVGTEVLAAFGGTFTPLAAASALRFVSSSTADDDGSTGVNSVIVYGIDANWDEQIEVVTMNGTTNVDTTSTWLGINRVAIYLAGSGQTNAGTITVTAVTGGATQATMPVGEGVTQQCIFFVPRNHQFLADWLYVNTVKQSAQDPVVIARAWVYSAINNAKQQVAQVKIDTAVANSEQLTPKHPFPIGEKSCFWLEVTSDKVDTLVSGRFSGILVRDVDA